MGGLGCAVLGLAVVLAGCGEAPEAATAEIGSWSVTAWGEAHEIFPEAPDLVAGEAAQAHVHVTVLDGFEPLTRGPVALVLTPVDGAPRPHVFTAPEPERPGIFPVPVTAPAAGDYDLAFRVGGEEIAAGRLRVGTGEESGRLLRAPAPRGGGAGAEPVPFLKEQQWRSDFATDWVREGRFSRELRGPGRLRAPAGGEATVTAPVAGVLRPEPWPWPGQSVRQAQPLFRLVPRVSEERSLAALAAHVSELEAEVEAARRRRQRLQGLLELEAVSRREVEEAVAREAGLEARFEAAGRDLRAARATRSGGSAAEAITVTVPFAGEVATVSASPGAAVAGGEPLARLVRRDPLWVEVALAPEEAMELGKSGAAGLVLEAGRGGPWSFGDEQVRLVSVAPEVGAGGQVTVLLEVADGGSGAGSGPGPGSGSLPLPALPLGSPVQASVLLPGTRQGVVIPETAVLDDGGTPVVYLQLSGERFVRQEVEVVARQGQRVLVAGLTPGQRLVTRGGNDIRRTVLMSSGEAHGHVH